LFFYDFTFGLKMERKKNYEGFLLSMQNVSFELKPVLHASTAHLSWAAGFLMLTNDWRKRFFSLCVCASCFSSFFLWRFPIRFYFWFFVGLLVQFLKIAFAQMENDSWETKWCYLILSTLTSNEREIHK
jgi:hypothetical protein